MEVDSNYMDGGRGLDDPEEPSTPEERMFDMDSPFLDREKDEEPIKTIRYEDTSSFFNYCYIGILLESLVKSGKRAKDMQQRSTW